MITIQAHALAHQRAQLPASIPEQPLADGAVADMMRAAIAGIVTRPKTVVQDFILNPDRIQPARQVQEPSLYAYRKPGNRREPPNFIFIQGQRVRLRNYKRFGQR